MSAATATPDIDTFGALLDDVQAVLQETGAWDGWDGQSAMPVAGVSGTALAVAWDPSLKKVRLIDAAPNAAGDPCDVAPEQLPAKAIRPAMAALASLAEMAAGSLAQSAADLLHLSRMLRSELEASDDCERNAGDDGACGEQSGAGS